MPGDCNNEAFYGAGTSLRHASSYCRTLVCNWEGCVHIHRQSTCRLARPVVQTKLNLLLGSAYSLQSNDGCRSESRSMSFTRLDLRGSRVGKDDRGFFTKRKILEVSIEFRVEVR